MLLGSEQVLPSRGFLRLASPDPRDCDQVFGPDPASILPATQKRTSQVFHGKNGKCENFDILSLILRSSADRDYRDGEDVRQYPSFSIPKSV